MLLITRAVDQHNQVSWQARAINISLIKHLRLSESLHHTPLFLFKQSLEQQVFKKYCVPL